MNTKRSEKHFDRVGKFIFIIAAVGGIPFLFVHGVRGELLLKIYLLTTLLLLIVFYTNWESLKKMWFWKAMLPVAMIHSAAIVALVRLNTRFPEIDQFPGMVYSALSVVLIAEVLLSSRFIEALRPKQAKRG